MAKGVVGKVDKLTPGDTIDPKKVLTPRMVASIKASPKGKMPPGLARYMANRKKMAGK